MQVSEESIYSMQVSEKIIYFFPKGGSSSTETTFTESFPKKFEFVVPLYVCRLCINFQDLCARLLGVAALRILLSPSLHAL